MRQILGTGVKALPLIVINIILSFSVALLIGKKLGVTQNTSILVGGGTAICGGTAIATLSRIIKAKEEEIAFAMAAIFLFDTLVSIFLSVFNDRIGIHSKSVCLCCRCSNQMTHPL